MSAVELRDATPADVDLLLNWANDTKTRQFAHGRALIARSDHLVWLADQLENPARILWVGMQDGRAVGSIRFDTVDDWTHARLSYVVAPDARGAGIGTELVRVGTEQFRARHPNCSIVAEVMRSNESSLRIFRRHGWVETDGLQNSVVCFQMHTSRSRPKSEDDDSVDTAAESTSGLES